MTISERYREIAREVSGFESRLTGQAESEARDVREVAKAAAGLAEWMEQVGDVPRMHLETRLTPVLLKAHNQLDRARLLFEEAGLEDHAASCWGLQQKIYRLLNDL